MIKASSVKKLLRESKTGRNFKEKFREMLGIRYDPKTEQHYLKDPQIGSDELSIRQLTEEFLGREFVEGLHQGPPTDAQLRTLTASRDDRNVALFEDVVGVTPSAMQDINAWSATVAGLVEVRLLQGYRSPEFLGDRLCTIEPTRVNGGKMIAVPYVNPSNIRVVPPGVEFPTANLSQLYVWAQPNLVVGQKLALDRNTVVYDLTGELMTSAETIGASLGWIKEYLQAAGIMGVAQATSNVVDLSITSQIGNNFRMEVTADATPNATYQTVGVTTNPNLPNAYNYINSQTKTFADWTSLSSAQQLLNLMRDPVNNLPFRTEITDVVVDPSQWQLALYVKHLTEVLTVTGTVATAPFQGSNSTFPPIVTRSADWGGAQSELNRWTPHHSNIWHQVLLDSGVTEANAEVYWFAGDFKKAFVWRQAWDLRTDQANPSSSEMLGKNIINEWVSQWSGRFVTREPRYVIRNTN